MSLSLTCMLALLLLCLAANGAQASVAYWEGNSCTGVLRVCRDGEAPEITSGGKTTKICSPNTFKRPTMIFDAQNWPSVLYTEWAMQIILMEQMQIPAVFADEMPPEKSSSHDFYKYETTKRADWEAWKGAAYPWDALVEGNKDPTCTEAAKTGKHCAHVMAEVWSGQLSKINKYIKKDKVIANVGQLGVFARLGWFTFKIIADAFEGITYRALVNDQVTQYFKRPVAYTEYCTKFRTGDADYATSLCKYLYVTLDAAGRELAKKDWETNIGSKFFFLPAALPEKLQTDAFLAGVTDIPPVKTVAAYRGFGEARTDKKAYVAEAPCSWTTYWPVQAPTVNVHVVQHTYGELVNLLDRTAYNLALVDRSKPMSAWKSDPNFMPIIMWWWTPEPTLEKWRYKGDVWKMEVVRLGKWTDRCENARQAVFVPEYKDKTCGTNGTAGHYNLPKDWQTECGQACKDAACDYPDELPSKAVSSSIRDYNPDAFSMLGKVEFTTFEAMNWLGQMELNTTYNALYPDKNIATRKVVCDWIKGNRAVWERWIPDTLLNTGCRKKSTDGLCSGHGSCVTPVGTKDIPGSCKCKMGYAGEMCERDVCGGFSELLDGSGCSGHGKCTQPDLAADPKCDCAVGWGAGKAAVGDRCAGVFASTLPQAMHNSSDKELNFYWDSAWGDLSLVEGYRLSKQTNTAKRIAIFQGSMGIRIFTVILAGLMALMSVVFLVMVQKHRKKTIISYAQPLFLQCILAGSFVSYLTVFLNTNLISNSAQCYATMWFGHLGFTVIFSVLFAKTYRLYLLVRASTKMLKKTIITKAFVFKWIMAINSVALILLLAMVIYGIVDPSVKLAPLGTIIERSNTFDVWVQCGAVGNNPIPLILLGYEALLLIIGAMMAWMTKDMKVAYGESKWVALTIYNMFILGIFVVGLHYGMWYVLSPDAQYLMISLAQILGTGLGMCLIFLPKLLDLNNDIKKVGSTMGSSTTMSGSEVTKMEQYKTEIDQLKSENKNLKISLDKTTSGSGELAVIATNKVAPSEFVGGSP